ncbi:MAG: hypothetical protein JNJ52_11345 [Flavobacterium sp.]|nr:hypothetical protein [Flavobacterium sp.]
MEKETFIEQILNSTNGITPVQPSDDLFAKIKNRIHEKQVIPMRVVVMVAASIALLVSLNIILLSIKTSKNETTIAVLEQSINQSNQLY